MRRLTWLVLIFVSVLFLLRGERFIRANSPTFDEANYLIAGYSYWKGYGFRLGFEHPPLLKLWWTIPLIFLNPSLPEDTQAWAKHDAWILGNQFLYEGQHTWQQLLFPARRMGMLLGIAMIWLVARWATRLAGYSAGMVAGVLVASDPNLLSQACLLCMDFGLGLFFVAGCYGLWEYVGTRQGFWFYFAGIAFGFALASKFSFLMCLVGVAGGCAYFVFYGGRLAIPSTPPEQEKTGLIALVPVALRLGFCVMAVLISTYFVIYADEFPRGLKQQFLRNSFQTPRYFWNGQVGTGWLAYFPLVLLYKMPIWLTFFTILGLYSGWKRRDIAFLLLPATIFFLLMMASKINLGWRVVLPVYPILIIVAARFLGQYHLLLNLAFILFVWLCSSRGVPHSISYFSEWVSPERAAQSFGDSNLDWGQGLISLKEYLDTRGNPSIYFSYSGTARPEAFGIRYQRLISWGQFDPSPEDPIDWRGPILLAVSVNNLQGIYLDDPQTFAWLKSRQPVSRTDGSIWVYEITNDWESLTRCHDLKISRLQNSLED